MAQRTNLTMTRRQFDLLSLQVYRPRLAAALQVVVK